MPSPLKSPAPSAPRLTSLVLNWPNMRGGAKVPSPPPSTTLRYAGPAPGTLSTAASSRPPPLKSPTTSASVLSKPVPVGNAAPKVKVPSPCPCPMVMVAVMESATTRSSLPSPSASAVAIGPASLPSG